MRRRIAKACCRVLGKKAGAEAVAAIRQEAGGARVRKGGRDEGLGTEFSAQERALEAHLKPCAQAGWFAAGNVGAKGGAQVREGEQKRVGRIARRRRAGGAQEQRAHRVHAKAQAVAQAVEGFEGEGGAQRLGGALEGQAAEQTRERAGAFTPW